MNYANKCPGCKNYILGEFCYTCNKNVNEFPNDSDIPDFLKDLFKNGGK